MKTKLIFIDFPFAKDKIEFLRENMDKAPFKNVYNVNQPETSQYIRKPVRLISYVGPNYQGAIIHKNLKDCTENIYEFRETMPNKARRNVRMALWATNKERFEIFRKMNWKLPYIDEAKDRREFIDIKLDGRISRCNQCYSLMGNKPHNCPGQKYLRCNEIGHNKQKCKSVDSKGCQNCNYSIPKHNALSNACPAYLKKAYETP